MDKKMMCDLCGEEGTTERRYIGGDIALTICGKCFAHISEAFAEEGENDEVEE